MYYLRLLISVVVLFPLFGQPVVGQSQRQVEYWMSVIENGNGIERLQAVTALGSFGPEAEPAIPLLVAELADPLKSIRVAAGRSLLQVGPSAIPVLVKVLSYEGERADMLRQGAHDVLVGFGAKSVPQLTDAIRTGGPDEIRRAAAVLEEIPEAADPAVPVLKTRLQDTIHTVADAAANAAGRLARVNDAAREMLIRGVEHQRLLTRARAILGLYECGAACDPARIEALSAGLKDESPLIRRNVANWLAEMDGGPPDALIQALGESLTDPNEDVRRHALDALRHAGPRAAPVKDDLVAVYLRHEDGPAIMTAKVALDSISRVPDSAIVAVMNDTTPYYRYIAAGHWAEYHPGSDRALPLFVEEWKSEDDLSRKSYLLTLVTRANENGQDTFERLWQSLSKHERRTVCEHMADESGLSRNLLYGTTGALPTFLRRLEYVRDEVIRESRNIRYSADEEFGITCTIRVLAWMGPAAQPALPLLREIHGAYPTSTGGASWYAAGAIDWITGARR